MEEPIYVTQPFLPPLEEFQEYLKEIWNSKILTNNGPFHQKLEKALCDYLGVQYISLFSNGTTALITALQAVRITGEVITSPFSFVATTHALWWNGIKPVFADIEPEYMNLDPDKLEAAITPQTTAILPVHVYGNPCQADKIQRVADIYGLKVIYDACHTFGVKSDGNSISNLGDLSILSFHATKVYNTFEGGAIVSHDEKTKKRIDFLKNFGFADEVTVVAPGINAKMNEFQAAFGMLQLEYIDEALEKRKQIAELYTNRLAEIKGLKMLKIFPGIKYNYPYFPIVIDQAAFGRSRDEVYNELRKNNIFARRYFYPLISNFPPYKGLPSASPENLPTAERISRQILCLPIYPNLKFEIVEHIASLIKNLAK